VPFDIPVTFVLYKVGDVIVQDGPLIFVHKPVPGAGLFPASVVEVVPDARHWSGPAFAWIGPGVLVVVITAWSELEPQALEIVQVKV
jgi:hypothetical protein